MTLTETLFASLILAAVTGLTIIAYKHPVGYRNIARVLLPAGLLYAFFRVASDLGGITAGIEFVTKQNVSIEVIKSAAAGLQHSYRDLKWTIAIAGIAAAYLVFLLYLPSTLGLLPTVKKEAPEYHPKNDA